MRLATNQTGLNDRFRIDFSALTIPAGKKEAAGTIKFIPIDSETTPDDDLLVTIRTAGGSSIVDGSTDIRLVDTDKASTAINLSFSHASLSKGDDSTNIVVTATLNGDRVKKDLRFPLVIDEAATEATGLGRDVDYSAVMNTITIPRRRVSGRETINIKPLNKGIGSIWVKAGSGGLTNDDGQTIRVSPSFIDITSEPATTATKLIATPFSIREDAGPRVVTLEITLNNPVSTDQTVAFIIEGGVEDLEGEEYEGAVDAVRDTEYSATPPSVVIPEGETKGRVTMTVTPVNNTDEEELRVIRVVAKIGTQVLDATGILITDDDSTSEEITLRVSPAEISESAGATEVTVTGTLHGKVFEEDVTVRLTISAEILRRRAI